MDMDKEAFEAISVLDNARGDAQRHSTESRAFSSATNAVQSAYVCLLVSMATKVSALATTTGKLNKEDPNALNLFPFLTMHRSSS